ncbi:MAG: histidine kinase [Gemmatimonadaceae bacterium]|nr:histidine kinase [Gemmatimonadaceae bacterium]
MTQALPPLPRITPRGVLLTAAGWLLYTVLFEIYFAVMLGAPFGASLPGRAIGSAWLALYSVPVWLVVIRGLDRSAWGWRVLAHAGLCPLYVAANWYTMDLISRRMYGAPIVPADLVIWQLLGFVFTYMVQFGLFHIVRAGQKLRWRERRQAALERLLREQQLAVLRSQLNPHFLFNSLNTISAVLGQDAEKARRLIARLGDVLRYAVDSVERDTVSLAEEWALTRSHLEVEQARLGERLEVQAEMAGALACQVPPMILQPLVENAIVHGIAPLPDGGQLRVSAEQTPDRVVLTVSNTGAAVAGDVALWESRGTALRNIRTRLRTLYGDGADLRLSSPAAGGFEAVVRLPAGGSHD